MFYQKGRFIALASTLLSAALLLGCATDRPLMPTPAIYQGAGAEPVFNASPSHQMQPAIDLLYITDRELETDPESTLPYGAGRSREIAFGSVIVEMGPDLTWPELELQSQLGQRTLPVNLTLGPVTEIGRFPRTPYRVEIAEQGVRYDPEVLAKHVKAKETLNSEIERRLDRAPRKEIVLYVHGFNNTFEDAAFTLAELCHFLGREHVCSLFTWPAGIGGRMLTAYGYDRESSEFGALHLKKMIRLLAKSPKLKKLHLLAHSRGTDMLLSALRELFLEIYTSGHSIDNLKIENVVLIAPDIDADVAEQRMNPIASDPDIYTARIADNLPFESLFTLTAYTSPGDRALRSSGILFRSRRAGQFSAKDASPEAIAFWKEVEFLKVIQVPSQRTDVFGHGYFTSNPLVSADLVSMIRYGRKPGDPERVLTPVVPPILWKIELDD